MTRSFATLALLLVGPLAAAPVPKATKRYPPDPERFQGAWEVVEENGKAPRDAPVVWTFTDERMHSSSGNSNWTIKLDPDQSPKQIDITGYPGIYEFDGDTLKIAYSVGRERPTGFTPGNGVYVNVMARAKDRPKK